MYIDRQGYRAGTSASTASKSIVLVLKNFVSAIPVGLKCETRNSC